MASDPRQAELFPEPASDQAAAERVAFVVPIYLPVTIPHDGTWRVETQASGNRMVTLIQPEGDGDG